MRHVGIEAIRALPRCGAWARSAGRPCRQPVVGDSPRCHYHGAGGRTRGRRTGAPLGSQNNLIHGRYSAAALARGREAAAAARQAQELVDAAMKIGKKAVRAQKRRKAKVG
jgi:hypothetical protein